MPPMLLLVPDEHAALETPPVPTSYEPVVQRTITPRQQYGIRLPDALIAATALELGFPLVTRNPQDFHTINGLIILNPFA